MAATALEIVLQELEQDRSLYAQDQLRRRIDALDRLETCLFHVAGSDDDQHHTLLSRVDSITARLESANRTFYQSVREDIRQGHGHQAMSGWLAMSDPNRQDDLVVHGDSYDYLDMVVSGILELDEPDDENVRLGPEMVFYQPTPARHIFDLIRRLKPAEEDVVIDVGSGLGQVPLLTAICTPAQCVGIEMTAAYVTCARRSAEALNIGNATFIQQDARVADFSRGTVFYFYTPFTGTILHEVLGKLKREASVRPIRVCTLGPCTTVVSQESWLMAAEPPSADRIAVFSAR